MKKVTIFGCLFGAALLAYGCENKNAKYPEPAPATTGTTTRNGSPLPGDMSRGAGGQSSTLGDDSRSRPGPLGEPTSPGTGSDPLSNPPSATTAPTPNVGPSSPSDTIASRLSEGEIAAIMVAANNGEIDHGKVAQKQAKDPAVKNFAKMMVDHHTEARNKQAKLTDKMALAAMENRKSREMTLDGQKTLEQLKELKGDDFDRAYIDQQVKMHQDVLSTLDSQILPSVQSAEFKTLLTEMRGRIEQHLKMAQDLQQKLSSKGNGG